ncbi:MAG TPA: histidinol-phosphate transaminase [Ilumatobacter sp.]|nr:histidinol-phosphate transaminase [Ilumatobacter sp.]
MIPVRDDLKALDGYHSPQVDVEVRLNTNESPLPPPDAFRDALAAEMSRIEWHRYPDREATELREAIGAMHGVPASMVFPANGSNEVLQTILLAYAGPGRTVATFEPSYQMHSQIARVVGSTVAEGERAADFTLSSVEMRRVVTESNPHVTFLTSPNNPTGLVEPRERVLELLDISNGLVVADEAYAQFADWSALDLIDESRPLVVTRTFSKTWSMAGVRLGYAIGPTWFVRELDKVVLPYHLDAAKQLAGRIALRFVDDMNDRVRLIVGERERISAAMRSMPIEVTPSGANFVLFRPLTVGGRDLWQRLLDQSVLVRDCSGWPRLADCLRVTVGTPQENDRFLAALATSLATHVEGDTNGATPT